MFHYSRICGGSELCRDAPRSFVRMKKNASQRNGLLAGGNWIIDQVKMIDVYPGPEQLANIREYAQGTGGAPYNVLVDLAKLGASFPLSGAGLVGEDVLGKSILTSCQQYGIDTRF